MSSLFSHVLNMSMTGSVVILLILLTRLLLKRSSKIFSYVLWSVVLFRLLCPVAFSAPVSVLNGLQPKTMEIADAFSTVSYFPDTTDSSAPGVLYMDVDNSVSMEHLEPMSSQKPALMRIASFVWISAALVMLAHGAVQYFRLRIRLTGAIRHSADIYLSDQISTAFVMGILRPRIYLPVGTPSDAYRFIIAHERHHIRRFDHVIRPLAYFTLCIHWFNPLVWAAFILAGRDMEMSCDEAVVKQLGIRIRADYCASLLRLATCNELISALPPAFGEGDTKGRVMNMAKWKKPQKWIMTVCIILCAAVLTVCTVNPVGAHAQAEEATYLNQCRQVLEHIQSSEGYCIITERDIHCSFIVNSASTAQNYRCNDDWLQINAIHEDTHSSIFAKMYLDGVFYDGTTFAANGIAGDMKWATGSDSVASQPWVASFRWNDAAVTLDSVEHTDTAVIIHLNIKDTFILADHTAQEYTVAFTFDSDGNFLNAKQIVEFSAGNIISYTMRDVSLDPELIRQQISLDHLPFQPIRKHDLILPCI